MKAVDLKKETGYCPFNPGYLKLLLSTRGMRMMQGLAGEIKKTTGSRRGLAGGVDLILPGDIWVNVPVEEEFAASSPLVLEKEGNTFFLSGHGGRIDVEPVPHLSFYDRTTSKGTPFYQIAILHGGYVHITPSNKCQFFDMDLYCRFCNEKKNFFPIAREFITMEEVLEIIDVAFTEGVADSVEFNIGYFDTADRGISFLEPFIKAVKRNFDTLVAVDAQPPEDIRWIDRTYAMGVDNISYHLEIFDKDIFAELCPGKSRMIGWDKYIEALSYAAGVFQSGAVSSNLIVGLESPESTISGIDYLTKNGVIPILPVFRPLKGTPLQDRATPDVEDIAPIYGYLYSAVKKSRINMSWSKNVSTYMTPLEGRYFAGEDAKLHVAMQNIYKSRIGGKAVRGLAGLRRRLKVKEVDESFESSGL